MRSSPYKEMIKEKGPFVEKWNWQVGERQTGKDFLEPTTLEEFDLGKQMQ